MNNAAFFYNTFERTKSKKNPTAKKVAKPKQAAKSPNATKLTKEDKTPKRRRDEKRQLSRLFPATKSPFKGFHNFSKRILSCCSSIFNSKFS